MVHADIKADNVLMEVCGEVPVVKLADLGKWPITHACICCVHPCSYGPIAHLLVVLCRTGLSKVIDRERLQSRDGSGRIAAGAEGTVPWMAPELHQKGQEGVAKTEHVEKVDIYSFAVLLWELLTGATPYREHNEMRIINDVVANGRRPPTPTDGDQQLCALMEQVCRSTLSNPNRLLFCFAPHCLTPIEAHDVACRA